MRLLVAGHLEPGGERALREALDWLRRRWGLSVIMACAGSPAERVAARWAEALGVETGEAFLGAVRGGSDARPDVVVILGAGSGRLESAWREAGVPCFRLAPRTIAEAFSLDFLHDELRRGYALSVRVLRLANVKGLSDRDARRLRGALADCAATTRAAQGMLRLLEAVSGAAAGAFSPAPAPTSLAR